MPSVKPMIDGFTLLPNALDGPSVDALTQTLSPLQTPGAAGTRNLLDDAGVCAAVSSPQIRALALPVVGPNCFVTRAILFDKTPAANWKVPWHQDLSIAVRERIEVEGFGPWSVKEGVIHVQPPREILENMVTLRLHLDPCDYSNGALRVLAGTHNLGKLSASQIAAQREVKSETVCELPRGGALLMRPLLLHASSAATAPAHRRVLHLEWAAHDLPDGLQWHRRVECGGE